VIKLRDDQYRLRNTTLTEAEAFLMEVGKKAAEHDRLDKAGIFARVTAYDIDDVVLGVETHAQGLDSLWNDFDKRQVEYAASPIEGDDSGIRVVFDIYPLRGDVLLQSVLPDWFYRDLWAAEPRIEHYGAADTPCDQDEDDRRLADWRSVREGHRVVAYDGLIERPDLEMIRTRVPDIDRRSDRAASDQVRRLETERQLGLGFGPKDRRSALIKAEDYMETDEGKTQIERVRLDMLKILPPEITDSMLIHGVAATTRRAS